MKYYRFTTLLLLALAVQISASEPASITGVDSSEILKNGMVHLYVSVPGEAEADTLPTIDDFQLQEWSSRNGEWKESQIEKLQFNGLKQDELSFLLLLDNSGSMYDSIAGKATERKEDQRIYFVLTALQDLFHSTQDYQDQFSIWTFNTNIENPTSFTADRNILTSTLTDITKPDAEEAYTELYRAIDTAVNELSLRNGRKVLILLSDGENYSYAENKQKPHPLWGNNLIELQDIEEKLQKRGITLYTIHYARAEDPDLADLSLKTGGLSFIASDKDELLHSYREIQNRINKEFKLSYKPDVDTNREKQIRVQFENTEMSPVFVFIWEIFWGLPPVLPWWLFCIFVVLSIILVIAIHKASFERIYAFPHLEVLSPYNNEKTVIQMQGDKTMIAINKERTVIMNDEEMANKDDDEAGITIVKDTKGRYLMKADQEIMVNNKTVISKELEPGDVIRSEGTLIIFDKPEE